MAWGDIGGTSRQPSQGRQPQQGGGMDMGGGMTPSPQGGGGGGSPYQQGGLFGSSGGGQSSNFAAPTGGMQGMQGGGMQNNSMPFQQNQGGGGYAHPNSPGMLAARGGPSPFGGGPWGGKMGQMQPNMGQKIGGALGSIFNNPQMMDRIKQGMQGRGGWNGPQLPNENRVPMGDGGPYAPGRPGEITYPEDPGNGGWGRGIMPMPKWEDTLNPNIGQGTGSNSRDSSDWAARHPEEQKPSWWDNIQTAQPTPGGPGMPGGQSWEDFMRQMQDPGMARPMQQGGGPYSPGGGGGSQTRNPALDQLMQEQIRKTGYKPPQVGDMVSNGWGGMMPYQEGYGKTWFT